MILDKLHVFLLVIVVFVLSGCTVIVEAAPAPSEVKAEETGKLISNNLRSISDLMVPPPEPPVNECLECHIDKQSLIDNAKPEEAVEKESTGVG
jgi:hypothetical protein